MPRWRYIQAIDWYCFWRTCGKWRFTQTKMNADKAKNWWFYLLFSNFFRKMQMTVRYTMYINLSIGCNVVKKTPGYPLAFWSRNWWVQDIGTVALCTCLPLVLICPNIFVISNMIVLAGWSFELPRNIWNWMGDHRPHLGSETSWNNLYLKPTILNGDINIYHQLTLVEALISRLVVKT